MNSTNLPDQIEKSTNTKRFLLTGHVDHGKSTLGEQLLYQCGIFPERDVEKVFQQARADKMYSFRWARLLDKVFGFIFSLNISQNLMIV